MSVIASFDNSEAISFDDINKALKNDGVVIIENFLDEKCCDSISSILEGDQKVNSNELSFIHINDAKFFSNALAESRSAFDLVTKKEVFRIAKNYLGKQIRLKCQRAYSTNKIYYFPWHTDNKFNDKKNQEFGIVFIVYLVDTDAGATEFVLGSQKYSHSFEANNFNENYISDNYHKQIARAPGKKGTAVISDTRTIHRGGFGNGRNVKRTSFWFQVESNMESAERLLLNPEFLPRNISSELSSYLGFDKPSGQDVHPVTTNIGRVLPYKYRINMFLKYTILVFLIPVHWARASVKDEFKSKIRKVLGIKSDWN
tara:strand:+ start:869 stop:1810 length:942 start_codon:yes stop_codon:yes gene_type:complete